MTRRNSSGASSSSSSSTGGASSDTTTPAVNSWQVSKAAWLSPSSGWSLDGSKPLSNLLKLATAQAHVDVLRPPIVNKLITGQIPLQLHILYLMMLYDVYEAMEAALSRHASHPLLAAVYNPSVLARTQGIAEDITYLLNLPAGREWQSHPQARAYRSKPPSALTTYVERIWALEQDSYTIPSGSGNYVYPPPPAEAYLLLSHAYVRYMGDLNGGQQIKASVAKAYHFDQSSNQGLRFYRFEGENGEEASPTELGKITAGVRKGMDSIGNQLDAAQRAALLQEANHAFELNIMLFSSFSEQEESRKSSLLALPAANLHPIPSPSLEGYANAANYMPEKRSKELKKARLAEQKVATVNTKRSLQPWLLLAGLVPVVLLARSMLQKVLA